MSEYYVGPKVVLIVGSILGGLVSMSFIQMCIKKRFAAIGSGAVMAYEIGTPVSEFVSLPPEPTGFLIGLFGVSICNLIFESLKKSDLSFKFSDIIDLIRGRRG